MVLKGAFDEAWLTLKSIGNTTVKPDELARSVLRLAMEGERDPVRLHDGALEGLISAGELIAYFALRFTAEDFPRLSSISNSIC